MRGLGRLWGRLCGGGPALGTRPAFPTEERDCRSPPCVPGLPPHESHLLLGGNLLDELHSVGPDFPISHAGAAAEAEPPRTATVVSKSSSDGGLCF